MLNKQINKHVISDIGKSYNYKCGQGQEGEGNLFREGDS